MASSAAATSAPTRPSRPAAAGVRPMIRRYTLPEMGAIWSDAARFEAMLRVELAVAARRRAAASSRRTHSRPSRRAPGSTSSGSREIEQTTDHDVIAFVSQVAESVGPEGRYLHLGLTSSDVVDTGLALQLRAAGERLLADCDRLLGALVARARTEADTVMMGRTHSVHAEPTTLGVKLASWAFELDRGRDAGWPRRSPRSPPARSPGRSGPTATSSPSSRPRSSPGSACGSTRSAPRSSSATGTRPARRRSRSSAARSSGSRPRSATSSTPRSASSRSRSERARRARSAMPHKRNPILSERIAGLARLLRGYARAALEDQPLWHERDISHTSAERVILPDATILLDYMLVRMTGARRRAASSGPSGCARTSSAASGSTPRRRVLVALVEDGGMPREEAYAIVQRCALRAADERVGLRDAAGARPGRGPAHRRSAGSTPASTTRRSSGTCPTIVARLDRIEVARPMTLAGAFVRSGKVRDLYDAG